MIAHQPNMVRLFDGTLVPSDSEAWRHECEVRYILNKVGAERDAHLQCIADKRGRASVEQLSKALMAAEPHYILSLPNKIERNRYMERFERAYGAWPAEQVKAAVKDLHKRQKMAIAQ